MVVVKTRVTTNIKDLSLGKKAVAELVKRMGGAEVSIGVLSTAQPYPDGTTVAEVALWNEFGTRSIPERSFLRSAVDDNGDKIDRWIKEMWQDAIHSTWIETRVNFPKLRKGLESIGFKVKELVQTKIQSNVPPPYGSGKHGNSSKEVAKRQEEKRKRGAVRGDTTLIETGHLLKSISWRAKVGSETSKG